MQDKGLTKYPEVTEFTKALYDSGNRSPHLLGFMIDEIEENLLSNPNEELFKKAIDVSCLLYFLLWFTNIIILFWSCVGIKMLLSEKCMYFQTSD